MRPEKAYSTNFRFFPFTTRLESGLAVILFLPAACSKNLQFCFAAQ
jgi:hypothetical protein